MNEQIKAGADIHAGDGGYQIGTRENYEAFVKVRNKSLAEARINRIGEQADLLGECMPTKVAGRYVGYVNVADIEKFAELIVVQCANIIWDEANKKDSAEINEGGYKILEYFGIDWRAEQSDERFGVE